MKKLVFILMFILFGCASFSATLEQGKLSNGLEYRIYKKSEIPLISLNIKIRAGSVFDELGKYGEAYILGKSLENCDSPKYKADRLRFIFDKYGVVSSVSIDKGYITISATALEENITPLFCLMHEILNSKLDIKGIDYVKRNTINAIKSLRNDKDYLAIHAAFSNLIKEGSYSHTSLGNIGAIKRITREDLISFYKKYFNAQNMVISISGGGFTSREIKDNLKFYFSSIPKGVNFNFPPVSFKKGFNIRDVVKPDTMQSYIYFAFPAFKYDTKNYYASKLLAFILGGNLSSFLTNDIRTKHGFAYSVFSFVYKLPRKSIFVIGLQTQNKFTLNAVERVFEDITSFDRYITKSNLEFAKSYIEGRTPIGLQLPQSIAASLSSGYMLGIKGLPWEYEVKKIKTVTIGDLKDAARILFSKDVSIGIVSYKNFSSDIKRIAKRYGFR